MSRKKRDFELVPSRVVAISGGAYERAFANQFDAVIAAGELSYEGPLVLVVYEGSNEEPTWLFERGTMREPHEPPLIRTDARDIRIVAAEDAEKILTGNLGSLVGAGSNVIDAFLSRDDRSEWRVEAGNWLATATKYGFLKALLDQNLGGVRSSAADIVNKDTGKDPGFFRLRSMLAEPLTAHYFQGSGWTFVAHEPLQFKDKPQRVGPGCTDVDLILRAPGGTEVRVQVKASGRPGTVEGGRIAHGEKPDELFRGLEKAIAQLPRTADAPSIIVLSAQWRISPLMDVASYFYGSTASYSWQPGVISISYADRARFFSPDCAHVGAVVLLDHCYGGGPSGYVCQVLVNPVATGGARCSPEWFMDGRTRQVCYRDGRVLRWDPMPPERQHVPDGTDIGDVLDGLANASPAPVPSP